MALIKSIKGKSPSIGEGTWIAENATLTGSIEVGQSCSIWYQAVIRGDVNHIRIGDRVNIQDGAIVHGSTNGPDTVIGNGVSIGHKAIVHGCVIQDNVLVGMGAIVLDNVVVESESLIAAGAVVVGGTTVESGFIYAGTPAKKIKKLSPEEIQRYIYETGAGYVQLKDWQ